MFFLNNQNYCQKKTTTRLVAMENPINGHAHPFGTLTITAFAGFL
jgi:hypothetical protein